MPDDDAYDPACLSVLAGMEPPRRDPADPTTPLLPVTSDRVRDALVRIMGDVGFSADQIRTRFPDLPDPDVDIEEVIAMVRSAPDVPADPSDEWPPVTSDPGGMPGGVPEPRE